LREEIFIAFLSAKALQRLAFKLYTWEFNEKKFIQQTRQNDEKIFYTEIISLNFSELQLNWLVQNLTKIEVLCSLLSQFHSPAFLVSTKPQSAS
jgi:hypothetical protein